jgi:Uncharacterized conserved protein (DUF2267)
VFYDGWNPSQVPVKYGAGEYVTRFARDARLHDTDVTKAAQVVTAVARRHMSAGVVDEAFALLPADLRRLLESTAPAEKLQLPLTNDGPEYPRTAASAGELQPMPELRLGFCLAPAAEPGRARKPARPDRAPGARPAALRPSRSRSSSRNQGHTMADQADT